MAVPAARRECDYGRDDGGECDSGDGDPPAEAAARALPGSGDGGAGPDDLVEPPTLVPSLELVAPAVLVGDSGNCAGEVADDLRNEDLAAVGVRHDACARVDSGAERVPVALQHLADIETYSDAE